MNAVPKETYYTYADLLSWDDDVRYELYYGEPVALASPTDVHQSILLELSIQIGTYLRGKSCRVFFAPFDVRIFEQEGDSPDDVDTVLQPDLMVICDTNKIDRRGIHGAPDMLVEILSPSTQQRDLLIKFEMYRKAGVKEYWVVYPDERMLMVFTLRDGEYIASCYGSDAKVPISVLEDCTIDLAAVFGEAPESAPAP